MNHPTLNFIIQVTMVMGLLMVVYLLVAPVMTGFLGPKKLIESRSVLEITDSRNESQRMIVTRAKNMLEENPSVRIEVVASGRGVNLLTQNSSQKQSIQSLINQGVVFTACENSLQQLSSNKYTPTALLTGVRLTPDGHSYAEQLKNDGYIDELA
jgi:intracellular sulfur oxidation DsrE/DsrF family protein